MKHKKNYKTVSEKYRSEGRGQLNDQEVEAYCVARMPATKAAVTKVLEEVNKVTTTPLKTVLDLGAGLGVGSLAAKEVFGANQFTLIESNSQMIKKGNELFGGDWIQDDICKARFTFHDLVLFSYSLGEIEERNRLSLIVKAWEVAQVLVVVEPGTPRGYETILQVRDTLIRASGHLLAPCPHMGTCPMKGTKMWCHFSARLSRTKEHKLAKGASLGWEDEKFSYIAFGKEAGQPVNARVVGSPRKAKGHVLLPLCGQGGLEERVVSKKEGEHYKQARKAYWGGAVVD